jgi:hypothetical protein
MAILLYVTAEALEHLGVHPAVQFWGPIVNNFPMRNVPIEERAFHPRDIEPQTEYIYLTTDMKFAYSRDNMISFLYPDQDLSFRFTASEGIIRTLDGKQFTAIIGCIGKVISTSQVELLDKDKVYHPLFDSGFTAMPKTPVAHKLPPVPPTRPAPGSPAAIAASKKAAKAESSKAAAESAKKAAPPTKGKKKSKKKADLIFGKYDEALCEMIIEFRLSSKKSYGYLEEKYDMPEADLKRLFTMQHLRTDRPNASLKELENSMGEATPSKRGRKPKAKPAADANSKKKAKSDDLSKYSADVQKQIIHMKKVSKKSYRYVAQKFKVPIDAVHRICSQNLKRPRKSVKR